jgi:hypothetical protein
MPYDLNWFARYGHLLTKEFERFQLERFHRNMDEFFARQKAKQQQK